nr:Uncharacterized protein [Enterobacter cloacae subsp. cloacae]
MAPQAWKSGNFPFSKSYFSLSIELMKRQIKMDSHHTDSVFLLNPIRLCCDFIFNSARCSHSVRDRLTQQREIVEGHWVFNVQREEFPGLLGGCLVSMFGIKKVYGVFFLSGCILILH